MNEKHPSGWPRVAVLGAGAVGSYFGGMLARANYGQVARNDLSCWVLAAAAEEVVAVARAAGVQLPSQDFTAAALKLAQAMGEATSSTAQDIAQGKRTEIDALNGFVVRRGAELGVPTPVNHTLYALVKLLEENLGENQ